MADLPFVDEHVTEVEAALVVAWAAVQRFWRPRLRGSAPALFIRVWRLEPAAGFAVEEEVAGERLSLTGVHCFSRYRLEFVVEPAGPGRSRIRARTSAQFPGLAGAAYRAAVIGSGGHTLVTRWMLRRIAADAESRRH